MPDAAGDHRGVGQYELGIRRTCCFVNLGNSNEDVNDWDGRGAYKAAGAPFRYNQAVPLATCVDGTSNTLCMSEFQSLKLDSYQGNYGTVMYSNGAGSGSVPSAAAAPRLRPLV